jgi:hypothetical protein
MKDIYRGADWRTKASHIYGEAYEHHALLIWLEEQGKSLDWILAEIEREQPGPDPRDFLGVGSRLPDVLSSESRLNPQWRMMAFRGIQGLVCHRYWRKLKPAQFELL